MQNQQKTDRLVTAAVVVILVTLFVRYLTHKWNWALMDDVGSILEVLNGFSPTWDWFKIRFHSDVTSIGRLFPLYWVQRTASYVLLAHHEFIGRLLRLLEFVAVLGVWTAAFRHEGRKAMWIALLALGCPLFYDTLAYPTIPELSAVLFIGLFVWVDRSFATGLKPVWLLLVLIPGCLFKESAVPYYVGYAAGALLLSMREERRPGRVFWALMLIALLSLVLFLKHIGARGAYTHRAFDGNRLPVILYFLTHHLPKGNPGAFLLIGLSAMVGVVVRQHSAVFRVIRENAPLWLGAIGYSAGLAYWGEPSYHLGPLALVWGPPAVLLFHRVAAPVFAEKKMYTAFSVVIILAMVALSTKALNRRFQENTEIGTMVDFLEQQAAAPVAQKIYWPNQGSITEQVQSLKLYLQIRRVPERKVPDPSDTEAFIIYHALDARLPSDVQDAVLQDDLLRTRYWRVARVRDIQSPSLSVY